MKKAFVIFSVTVNLLLVISLICILQMDRAEKAAQERSRREAVEAIKAEAVILIERAEMSYRKGDVACACRSLEIAQYALFGYENEKVTSLLGEAAVFFSDKEREKTEDLFIAFADEIKKVILGELDIAESQTAFEVSSETIDDSIGDNSEGKLWEGATVKEDTARGTAEKMLGKNLLLSSCENSIFPERYIFAGGNTYAALTRVGGEITEALFYAGNEKLRISEYKALSLMNGFLENNGYKELSLDFHFDLDGVYYARFFSSDDPELYVTLGIRGTSGNVCLFEAERMRSYTKKGK